MATGSPGVAAPGDSWGGGPAQGMADAVAPDVADATAPVTADEAAQETAGSNGGPGQYDRATMETEPVGRRLVANLRGALGNVSALPGRARQRSNARERTRIAARRLEALQSLATELAAALTTAQITELLMERGVIALRASGSAVFLIEPGNAILTAIGWRGHSDAHARAMGRLPLDLHTPVTDVARSGEPVFIEQPREYLDRYGPVLRRLGVVPRPRAIAAVPLAVDDRRFGVLAFNWDREHSLEPDRQAFICALARLGASAMERGRLFDAERTALRLAESAQRRLDLLADSGRVLAISLDYEEILSRLAGLALPVMGDVCIVDVLGEAESRRHVATANPAIGATAALIEGRLAEPAAQDAITRVVREGTSGAFQVDPSVAGSPVPDLRWGLGVPIRVRDRTIGALVLLRREDRPYDAEEIVVAEELGDRAGRALDNARLHGEVGRLADRERRHAAELEAAIAALGEGILVANPDGTIRLSNAAADRLLGGPAVSLDDVLDRLRDSDDQRPSSLSRGPAEYRLVQGRTAWIEITAYPVAGAAGLVSESIVIVCRDVTAFRQGQALREAFLGLLSHELRTPVTTIYGGASMLAKPGKALDPALTHEILTDIASESDRLYRLVEDLLVLARFDEGFELGDEPALLQHLVPSVVEQERGRWPLVTFEVSVAPDLPAVSGDETSITQVVRNLLSNAAKYSGPDAVVTTVVEPDPEGVVVRVRDEGKGIDPLEAETIFDPFYRSPSTAKMAGGAGIGLYVSRRLVGAMNGRIWAARRPDRGSEFSFVLPLYRADVDD